MLGLTERMAQIDARLTEIRSLADTAENVKELSAEADSLIEERSNIEARQKLLERVANDNNPQNTLEKSPEQRKDKTMNKEEILSMPEYRSAWVKTLQGNKLTEAEERAYASGDSGNAVPTTVVGMFFEKLKKLAPMLNEITLLHVAGNLKFVAESTNNAAEAKHTENSAVTAAADTVINVTLSGYEFFKVISISKTASTMSVPAFEDWLVSMLSRDLARAIDNYIINDTTNGIVVVTTWTSNTNQILNTAGPTYANILSLIQLLPAGYDVNAKFLMHKATLWGKLASIVDSQGQPILIKDMVNGPGSKILGFPVIVDDYVTSANGAIYLGDFSTVVGNMPQEIGIDRSTESGFKSNSIDYRGSAIFDSKPANKEAIVRFVTTV